MDYLGSFQLWASNNVSCDVPFLNSTVAERSNFPQLLKDTRNLFSFVYDVSVSGLNVG